MTPYEAYGRAWARTKAVRPLVYTNEYQRLFNQLVEHLNEITDKKKYVYFENPLNEERIDELQKYFVTDKTIALPAEHVDIFDKGFWNEKALMLKELCYSHKPKAEPEKVKATLIAVARRNDNDYFLHHVYECPA